MVARGECFKQICYGDVGTALCSGFPLGLRADNDGRGGGAEWKMNITCHGPIKADLTREQGTVTYAVEGQECGQLGYLKGRRSNRHYEGN